MQRKILLTLTAASLVSFVGVGSHQRPPSPPLDRASAALRRILAATWRTRDGVAGITATRPSSAYTKNRSSTFSGGYSLERSPRMVSASVSLPDGHWLSES